MVCCLPQILLGPFLNTLSHLTVPRIFLKSKEVMTALQDVIFRQKKSLKTQNISSSFLKLSKKNFWKKYSIEPVKGRGHKLKLTFLQQKGFTFNAWTLVTQTILYSSKTKLFRLLYCVPWWKDYNLGLWFLFFSNDLCKSNSLHSHNLIINFFEANFEDNISKLDRFHQNNCFKVVKPKPFLVAQSLENNSV